MNRRRFLTIASAALAGATRPLAARGAQGPRMAVTTDDFTVLDGALPVPERGARILDALRRQPRSKTSNGCRLNSIA